MPSPWDSEGSGQGRYFADLHIHSRFSRATSRSITPETLDYWGSRKGLTLLGTGDLTHPGWLAELNEKLTLTDEGLYRLKENSGGTRFIPTGEVSAIYKQDGRTRKIHLVVLAPDLPAAVRFSQALAARGNVCSDGRPILGLSARNILEIALTADPRMIIIPAHIWTPWFSLFGAKSGFDRLEDCFLDLSGHITALETGLSSDPAMNRLISALDKYFLVSSSDAHSAEKLGREATVLAGEPSQPGLWAALTEGKGLMGTVEFFPEEGKYHLDGHSQCGTVLTPAETREVKGICPVCGQMLTIGVLHRVMELADRDEPPERLPDWHILPLPELLGQVLGQGPGSGAVAAGYDRLVAKFGSEFNLLLNVPPETIEAEAGSLLALGIRRMRQGDVRAAGGYDGRFGVIEVLSDRDRQEARGQGFLFEAPRRRGRTKAVRLRPKASGEEKPAAPAVRRRKAATSLLADLSPEQKEAVTSDARTLAVTAGPGSGKTLVLIRRAAFQARRLGLGPEQILLTTYTRKAAETLAQRLSDPLLELSNPEKVTAATLHALALSLVRRQKPGWSLAPDHFLETLLAAQSKGLNLSPRKLALAVSYRKNTGRWPADLENRPELAKAAGGYQAALAEKQYWDFDDLIAEAASGPAGFPWQLILADEIQDFTPAQYRFLKHLSQKAHLTAIGDPDQSVYGFRGAAPEIFRDLAADHPDLAVLKLTANYRSVRHICQLAEVSRPSSQTDPQPRLCARTGPSQKIVRLVFRTPRDEAAYTVKKIREHLGVMDLGSEGRFSREKEALPNLALADIAVLFRWRFQAREIAAALEEAGLAYQLAGEEELTAADGLDFKAGRINLLTIHAAKGLEFRLVFLLGLEEDLFPSRRPDFSGSGELEEARLFYVALTRAKDKLYLSRCFYRIHCGERLSGAPSPFWSGLDGFCLDKNIRTRSQDRTASLF
jgi:DNA helicase-2/ATP-dependent DNA helicase PcrA